MKSRILRVVWLVTAVASVGACVSAPLPPRPSAAELARLDAAHFPLTVAVQSTQNPDHSERLIRTLRRTGLFDRVDSVSALPDADLMATVYRRAAGSAVVPLFTIISLGLYPTSVEEEWGEAFFLRKNRTPGERVHVDSIYSGTSTLGWWAIAKSFSPNHAFIGPQRTRRYKQAFALAILTSFEDSGLLNDIVTD